MPKDWTGNKTSVFANLAASNHSTQDRADNDYYASEPRTIDELFAVETFNEYIWEPAYGEGHLSKKMVEHGKQVFSTDLVDRGYGDGVVDFFSTTRTDQNIDIITNPPYVIAQEFIEKAIDVVKPGNKVAMLLKLTFLEGQKRYKFFKKYPPKTIYVYSSRRNCARNGDFETFQSSAVCFAWFVWEKGFTGEPVVRWLE